MEQERQLQQLPLEGVQQMLTDARDKLRLDPQSRDAQAAFIGTYRRVSEELNTPDRRRQLIDFATRRYQTALPEVVEGKRDKMEELSRIQSLLKSPELTAVERSQLELVYSQRLEPKADLINERALYVLATLPPDQLQSEYQRIREDQLERQKKEKRNATRVTQLTRIVNDMVNPSLNNPVGWEDVTMELVFTDPILEATLYEQYAGDIFKLWSESENLSPRFQAAVDVIRFKLRDNKQFTQEEAGLIQAVLLAYRLPASDVGTALDNLMDEKNGLLRAWKDREIAIVERQFSMTEAPAIDLDLLAERVHAENQEVRLKEASVEEQAEREVQAIQEAEVGSVAESESEMGSSSQRRLEKDMTIESTSREIASIVEKVFPEFMKSDEGFTQDAMMKKTQAIPREFHFNIHDVARYVLKRRVTVEGGKRIFYADDVIQLLTSQLNNPDIQSNVSDKAYVDLQRRQLDYRLPALLRKIGNIMTGGTVELESSQINWDAVTKSKGMDRLIDFLEALSSGSFSPSQLQRFSEIKASEFREVVTSRINALQRTPNNIVAMLNYVYSVLPYAPLNNQVKADFEKMATKKVREMSRALEDNVRSQKRNIQQEVASARTRMSSRRYSSRS